MNKALHPKDDVDRLYDSRKKKVRGFASIEDSDNISIKRLKNYKISSEEYSLQPLETIQTTRGSAKQK